MSPEIFERALTLVWLAVGIWALFSMLRRAIAKGTAEAFRDVLNGVVVTEHIERSGDEKHRTVTRTTTTVSIEPRWPR